MLQSNAEKQTVEDPKQLEQVIMHLVTNISSPATGDGSRSSSPDDHSSSSLRLSIIPPRKDHIVNAIEKIYGVIKINDRPNMGNSASSNINFRSVCQEPTLLPTFNEKNSNAIKIQELPNEEVFQFKAKQIYNQTPKPKATSFEECFLNFDDNGKYIAPSLIPKVSDQVLAAVQLDNNGGCHITYGQPLRHKRPIDGDNLTHTYKRKTVENEMDKDDANEMEVANSVLFGNNELESLFEDNGKALPTKSLFTEIIIT